MHLVQLLLPLYDNDGRRFEEPAFSAVREELTRRFGGVTAYMRSPATGLWTTDSGAVNRDDVVMVDVMVDSVDRAWWREYSADLARAFRQAEVVVRAIPIEKLSVSPA